ncbi:MAG: PQQ-binding-like beta-propeller repeat protein [Anaerolineales bacterium]|nr:PQQ-binding-like beta-propeller repeat protein [Anaerolineales bacterium]
MSTADSAPPPAQARLARWQAWALVSALVLTSVVWIAVDWLRQPEAVAPRHELGALAPGWELVGQLTQLQLALPPAPAADAVAFVGQAAGQAEMALEAYGVPSGELLWRLDEAALTRPRGWPADWSWSAPVSYRWSGLAAAEGVVYAAEAYLLDTAVNAYDLHTGQRLWHHRLGILNGSDVSQLALFDDRIVAHIQKPDFNGVYVLAREQGFLLRQRTGDVHWVFWVDDEPHRIYEASDDTINVSQTAAWRTTVGGCGIQAQVTAALVLARVQGCDGAPARIVALARQTGDILWQFNDPVAGNLAVDGEVLYVLTADAQLWAIDLATQQSEVIASFTPSLAAFTPDAVVFLGVNAGVAAVYLGDSGQLFLLRRVAE